MMNIYPELSGIHTTYYVMFIKHVIQQSVREIKRTASGKCASQVAEVIINSKTEYSIQNNMFSASQQNLAFTTQRGRITYNSENK